MRKAIKVLAGISLIIVFIFLIKELFNKNEEFDNLNKIYKESIIINDSLKLDNNKLDLKLDSLNIKKASSDSLIASLETKIIESANEPCSHRLILEKSYSKQLKSALTDCEERETLYVSKISNYATINVNNEVVLVECMQAIEQTESKDKQRKVFRWVERAGWVALIALLLL